MKDEFLKKVFLPALIAIAVVSFIPISQPFNADGAQTITIFLGHKQLRAVVVDTPALREKGLSGKDSLSPDQAMLFVFDRPGPYGIWMKDMKFPIDILWLDPSKRVVSIKENALPSSYPEIFIPGAGAKYVLEISAGLAAENNLKIGDEVSF